MPSDGKHYTKDIKLRLEKARLRMRAIAIRKARQKVNISFYADSADRARADAGCQLLHGVTFAMFCKQQWQAFAAVTPRPPRRRKIEEMDSRELFFAQFPEKDKLIAETVLAMAAYMEPGDMMTTDEVMDAYDAPPEARTMPEYRAVGAVMKVLGFARLQIARDGKRVWVYRKPANMLVPPAE